jgi:2-oxoisovalerate dehydrogenase E1 component alpha subunit
MLINHLLPSGDLTDSGKEIWQSLTEKVKQDLGRLLLEARALDHRMVYWQRQGKIGTYAPIEGQEAAQVGSSYALEDSDWIFPSYREQAVAFVRGVPFVSIISYWRGIIDGCKPPEGKRYVPPTVPIATHLPHAVGAAWSIKIKEEEGIAIAYFGDGATSEGDFHEALNFASLYQLPVLFFCQNNGYAISVPFTQQSATKTVVEKAKAYAMDAYYVDGNDVLAVYDVVCRAKKLRRPALIEAVTYRIGAHTTADDASRYRLETEVKSWLQRDPIQRYKRLCAKEGIEIAASDIYAQLDLAMNEVERKPLSAEQLFAHVYEEEGGVANANNGASNC